MQQHRPGPVLAPVRFAPCLEQVVRHPRRGNYSSVAPHLPIYHMPRILRVYDKLPHGIVHPDCFRYGLAVIMPRLVLLRITLRESLRVFVLPMPSGHLHHSNQLIRVMPLEAACNTVNPRNDNIQRIRVNLPVHIRRSEKRQPCIIVLTRHRVRGRHTNHASIIASLCPRGCIGYFGLVEDGAAVPIPTNPGIPVGAELRQPFRRHLFRPGRIKVGRHQLFVSCRRPIHMQRVQVSDPFPVDLFLALQFR